MTGEIPKFLHNQDIERLKDPLENQIIQQQNIDRLIQINSAISYVSTQAYSGSIPILERRSLIRRSSLLGIGSSVKALNRIVDYIENAFLSVNFLEIVTSHMSNAGKLEGVKLAMHDRKTWSNHNIDNFKCQIEKEGTIKKLAYFSARHAYRESEYSITASVNSISFGTALEWTLMTLTHEMLHSHVRVIINSIFFSEEKTEEENYKSYYNKYRKKVEMKNEGTYTLIDSIREIFFTYCIRSITLGSLTEKKEYKDFQEPGPGAKLFLPKFEDFYSTFQRENRNLNEIFVHVLDLHYFYGGRTSKYIPLIWSSWSAVPHINADIRQYILRSLLAIASK
ncbi:MAG: hypothetical protein IPP56_11140, partial [Bacteroidetes bacterium]|nr:hypothetical protein [Bacteroidota bacterium]